MKPARIAVLAIALTAGVTAAYLSRRSPPPAPVAPVVQAPKADTVDVLVAAKDIALGEAVTAAELKWEPWPKESAAATIRRGDDPNAQTELAGSLARVSILQGEPIRRERLVKPDGSGFMSAILPSGMRALAISIDNVGRNSAGGFILPNDRVDVVRTYRDDAASKSSGSEVYRSDTILENIRILAIGQNVQERNGERVVVGETATLELTPDQVDVVTLAQKVGTLSLALRSLADRKQPATAVREKEDSLTVVRFGVPSQTVPR